MSETNFAPTKTTRTDVQIGLVFEDQRTGDLRQVVYADSRVVLVRDETGSSTLIDRESFESELGTRYRARFDADPPIDGGQYDSVRYFLAEYERQDGRKARHKANALQEAVDLLAAPGDDDVAGTPEPTAGSGGDGDDAATDGATADVVSTAGGDAGTAADGDPGESGETEVPFEEIPGIGPDTAGKLRSQGFITEADVRGVDDDVLLSVAGVGPANLENIREYLD